MEKDYPILKRASAPRPSGEWSEGVSMCLRTTTPLSATTRGPERSGPETVS